MMIKVMMYILFLICHFQFSESLIDAIHTDIKEAEQALETPESQTFLSHSFFKTEGGNANGCT